MNTFFIMLLFLSFWLIQLLLSRRQIKTYSDELRKMKKYKEGHLGVGASKTNFIFGKGVILIIVTDLDGVIIDSSEMRGTTVFAKFIELREWRGKHTEDIYKEIKHKGLRKAFVQAVGLINSEREKAELAALTY